MNYSSLHSSQIRVWLQYKIFFISGEVRSHENCIYNCERDLVERQFNCTPNPLFKNSLPLIDFKTVKLDFCDQNDIRVDRKVCVKECKRDCTEEYFNPFKTQSRDETKNNSIRFEARNLPIFQYKFEPQYSFVQFISNIGGIFSLWYGFSVSDIYVIIKKILIFIKIYLTQYLFKYLDSLIETLKNTRFLKFILKVIIIFKKFIDRLDKYDIKLFVKSHKFISIFQLT